ncbi:uncharacterized protein LOC122724582 [Manihot esculenta]|uniref:uncharacterized protein LOC122724582 n=1 Tax=Manihot esculenta TaxID=3983 RepID=UPI001CC4D0BB|nr:uncharacterized protein LOC122724582 [Manihot esculenta]
MKHRLQIRLHAPPQAACPRPRAAHSPCRLSICFPVKHRLQIRPHAPPQVACPRPRATHSPRRLPICFPVKHRLQIRPHAPPQAACLRPHAGACTIFRRPFHAGDSSSSIAQRRRLQPNRSGRLFNLPSHALRPCADACTIFWRPFHAGDSSPVGPIACPTRLTLDLLFTGANPSFLADSDSVSMAQSNIAHSSNSFTYLTKSLPIGSWILDSSTSDHISGNPSLFSTLVSPSTPSKVTLANGSQT